MTTTYEELQKQAEAAMAEADQKWADVLTSRTRLHYAVSVAARHGVALPETVLEPLLECDKAIAEWSVAIEKSDDLDRQLAESQPSRPVQ